MRLFSTEDIAKVRQLSEGDLVLNRWYVVEFFPYLSVCDVLFNRLTHLYLQYLTYPSVQEDFEISKKRLSQIPAFVFPNKQIAGDGLEK